MAAAAVAILKKKKEDERDYEEGMMELAARKAAGGTPAFAPSPRAQAAQAKLGAEKAASAARKKAEKELWEVPFQLPKQELVAAWYQRGYVQGSVAACIIMNFIASIIEKEIDPFVPELQTYRNVWVSIDTTFTIIFVIELLVNIYGNFFARFWRSGWNVFDFVIVLVSVLSAVGALSGPLKLLKVFRAFRVFRLFKRIKSLNQIIMALLNAVPGVLNAFVIMVIVMAIYAIIGVEIFSTFGESGSFTTVQQIGNGDNVSFAETVISAETTRGFNYGQEYYGTFSRALFTLFQVLTGESWAEVVARPLIFGYAPRAAFGTSFYFSSFIILMQIVLINVVVAVLLDKFVAAPPKEDEVDDNEDGIPDRFQTDEAIAEYTAKVEAKEARTEARQAKLAAKANAHDGGGGACGGASDAAVLALRREVDEKLGGVVAMQKQLEHLTKLVEALVASNKVTPRLPPPSAATGSSSDLTS